MTTTSIRFTAPIGVNCQGSQHRDELDSRDAGQGVLKGIAFGGPLGSLIGLVILMLVMPVLGPGAMLAGTIVGLVAGIVLGAFGGLYTRVRAHEVAVSRPAQAQTTARTLQRCSAD